METSETVGMSRSIDYLKQLEGPTCQRLQRQGAVFTGARKNSMTFDGMGRVRRNAAPLPYFSSFAVHLAFMRGRKARIEFLCVAIVLGSMITSGRVQETIAEFWINRASHQVCAGGSRNCARRASVVRSFGCAGSLKRTGLQRHILCSPGKNREFEKIRALWVSGGCEETP